MPYTRVLPRDLFNEANLLKNVGQLWIALDEWAGHRAAFSRSDVPSFNIQQDQSDGSIYIANVGLYVGRQFHHLRRPLNSRRSWPLYIQSLEKDFDPIDVFIENGTMTPEFRKFIAR